MKRDKYKFYSYRCSSSYLYDILNLKLLLLYFLETKSEWYSTVGCFPLHSVYICQRFIYTFVSLVFNFLLPTLKVFSLSPKTLTERKSRQMPKNYLLLYIQTYPKYWTTALVLILSHTPPHRTSHVPTAHRGHISINVHKNTGAAFKVSPSPAKPIPKNDLRDWNLILGAFLSSFAVDPRELANETPY